MAEYIITNVKITPNPVEAGKSFVISVTVEEVTYCILGLDGSVITAKDGTIINGLWEPSEFALKALDGDTIAAKDGSVILGLG